MVTFSKTFLLLQQEGYLIQSALLSGLHHLRSARQDTKGQLYTAFFQLSIGLERLMKSTFIINFMRENSMSAPTDKQLRNFGHDLVALFNQLIKLEIVDTPNPLQEIKRDSIEWEILSFLADFANGARYHNIDSLVQKHKFLNPLEAWNRVIERTLKEDVRNSDKHRIVRQSAMLARATKGMAIVVGTDLDGNSLDLFAMYSQPRFQDIAAGHLANHTLVLIRALVCQLDDVSHVVLTDPNNLALKEIPIPHMVEFFDFIHYEKSQVLKKRRWP